MRQALHIFHKDARRAWPQIALVIALTALVAWRLATEPISFDSWMPPSHSSFVYFLFLAWGYFTAYAVFEDRLVGDRQFWLTRPYSWKSLLAAKCLLVAAFVNFPVLLADIAIIGVQGLSPAAAWSHLLWRQAAVICLFLLPYTALAAVTSNLAQFTGTAVSIAVLVLILHSNRRFNADRWPEALQVLAVMLGCAAVVLWQYARRSAAASRCVLGCAAALWAVSIWGPSPAAFLLHAEQPTDVLPAVRVVLTPGERWSVTADRLTLPVDVVGLPTEAMAEWDQLLLRIDGIRGPALLPGTHLGPSPGRPARLSFWLPPEVPYARNVNLEISVRLTIFGPPNRVYLTAGSGPYRIPGLGNCYTSPSLLDRPTSMVCRSALGRIADLFVGDGSKVINRSYDGGGSLQESPIQTTQPIPLPSAEFTVVSRQAIAHIRRVLDLRNIRLADYVTERP